MHDEFARVRALIFEPYTLFRVAAISGPNVNVTEQGFRSNGDGAPWPPSKDALFIFGGSTTFGYGVADRDTIPAQLAARLQLPVYNFATPNYVAIQERIRLEQLLIDGAVPRVAIFIDGFDEFIGPYYEPVMMQRFVEATMQRSKLQKLLHREQPVECRVPDPAAVLDRYAANAKLIRGVCRQFGIRPLFVWQPVPCYRYEGPAESHGDAAPLIECVQQGYALMSNRRDFDDDEFLWLADMQAGRTENLYVDADHYTSAFSGEIAGRIAQHLLVKGFLP